MIIDESTMINAVDLDQYTIIDESSMINDDFENFSGPICRNGKLDLGWKISRLVNISNKESEFSASFLESYFIVRTLEYYRYTIFQ